MEEETGFITAATQVTFTQLSRSRAKFSVLRGTWGEEAVDEALVLKLDELRKMVNQGYDML